MNYFLIEGKQRICIEGSGTRVCYCWGPLFASGQPLSSQAVEAWVQGPRGPVPLVKHKGH